MPTLLPPNLLLLGAAEELLPGWCRSLDGWNSLLIDYHPPMVWRLWRQWGDHRVLLHHVHACAEGAALWHPHPWPSIVRVIAGQYRMRVGYGEGNEPPLTAATLWLMTGSVYMMDEPNGWHAVEPTTSSLSVMLTGKPWQRVMPTPPSHPCLSGCHPRNLK